jgi:hypothetical protein
LSAPCIYVCFDTVLIRGDAAVRTRSYARYGYSFAPQIPLFYVGTGEVTVVGRSPKVIVLKYKQKSRYQKKNGHRQPYLKVKILSI